MKNKKSLMAISAILILIYHLWINITNLRGEIYLRKLCVIGVDIFFFISAYSIGKSNRSYKDFVTNRFKNIYFEFLVFSIIGAFYLKWSLSKFIGTIIGLELIKSGGGSFLWFVPGIMIVYLTLPLIKKLDIKYPKVTPIILSILYLLVVILLSSFSSYNALFILINRIPIILVGYYFARYDIFDKLNKNKMVYWSLSIICIIIGLLISYYVFINHFRITWFKDIFYVLYIPLIIGIILLVDKIKVNKLINVLGSITLELYGLQMIFGFKIANMVYRYVDHKLISNILTIVILIVMAIVFNYVIKLKDKFSKKN